MNKIKTLFDISPELETSEPQESRITLNEITLLSKMQAVTRYNLGASSIRKVAEDCGHWSGSANGWHTTGRRSMTFLKAL